MFQTLKEMPPDDHVKTLMEWASNRAHTLRVPIRTQLKDAEERMKELLKRKNEISRSEERRKVFWQFGTIAGVFGMVVFFSGISLKELISSDIKDTSSFEIWTSSINPEFLFLGFGGVALVMALTIFRSTFLRSSDYQMTRLDIELKNVEEDLSRLSRLQDANLEEIVMERNPEI